MTQEEYFAVVKEYVKPYMSEGRHTQHSNEIMGILMDFWEENLDYQINKHTWPRR